MTNWKPTDKILMCTVFDIFLKHTFAHGILKIIRRDRQHARVTAAPTAPWVILIFVFSHNWTLRGNVFALTCLVSPKHYLGEQIYQRLKNALGQAGKSGEETLHVCWYVYCHIINRKKYIQALKISDMVTNLLIRELDRRLSDIIISFQTAIHN